MADCPMGTPVAAVRRGGDLVRDQDKIMLVLAYVGLLALIPLLTVRDSEYVQFHARQGMALFICWLAYFSLMCLLGVLPHPAFVAALLGLGHLGFFGLSIVAIIKAFEPRRWSIPVVCALARKL